MDNSNTFALFFNDLICGSVAGVANCLSGFVLDTIKVRMQTQKIGMIKCIVNIVQKQGFLMLFSGIYYPLVTIPLANAVSFSSYELYKNITKKNQLSFWNGVEAGAFSGFIGCSVLTPVQLVKCRMQISEHQFKTSRQCLKFILKTEGIKGIYKGNFSTIMRQTPSLATQFATYQMIKKYFLDKNKKQKLDLIQSIITGGFAGIGAWINSYPQDVVKTRIQTSKKLYPKHKFIPDGGFISCWRQIYHEQGVRGFLRGIQPCMIRAVIANGAMIAAYQAAQGYTKPLIFY